MGVVCLMMETDSGESPLTMEGFLEMRHYKTEWCPNQSGKSGDTKPFFQVGRTKAGDRRSSSICVPNRSPGAVRPKIVSCPRFSLRCAVMRLGNGPKKICVHQRSQRIELFPFLQCQRRLAVPVLPVFPVVHRGFLFFSVISVVKILLCSSFFCGPSLFFVPFVEEVRFCGACG